jgi:hypothetical protein
MKTTIGLVSVLLMLVAPLARNPQSKSPEIVRLSSIRTGNEVKLVIDPNPNNDPDVPRVLMELCHERGAKFPILTIFRENNTVSDIYNVLDVAGKAGCQNMQTIMGVDKVGLFRLKICKIRLETIE